MLRKTVFCLFCTFALGPAIAQAQQKTLVDFGKNFDVAAVETRDAKLSLKDGVLRMDAEKPDAAAGFTLKAPEGRWNLTPFHEVAVDVRNAGQNPVTVTGRAKDPQADGKKHCVTASVTLAPGERNILRVKLVQALPPELRLSLFGMREKPLGLYADIDSSHVTQLAIYVAKPGEGCSVEFGSPRVWTLSEPNEPIDASQLFPMIDKFGQFIHRDWPGKTHSEEDLAAQKHKEAADLAAHPGPAEWDQYGGWKNGPKLKATGFFRTEKYNGKWWLVDPEGHLFWSMGINCVTTRYGARTPITDREHWFAELPAAGSPLAKFFSGNSHAAHGYYKNMDKFQEYNFTRANLLRKYGDDWDKQYVDLTEKRLRSWGINTIACMSDARPYKEKTPYVSMFGSDSKKLAGSSGYWRKFPDVFDPAFVEDARNKMATKEKDKIGDPWCIGMFVENEMGWGDQVSLSIATLCSPADQAAKVAFIDDLKKKHETIEKLNAVWGTNHASWDALLKSTTTPNREKARADLEAFYTRTAERYFQVTRDAIKELAPEMMDLGCRFSRSNPLCVRAAAKYCDVISFNRYQYSVADLRMPEGVDKPAILGEFHFGALDRGIFHTGLSPTADQEDRAKAYKAYVESALHNPFIVGAHWFQLIDQAATSRADEENYQIGFLDVCDTPHPELIEAARQIGDKMYTLRDGQQRIAAVVGGPP